MKIFNIEKYIKVTEIPRPSIVHIWTVPESYRESGFFISCQGGELPREIPACHPSGVSYVGSLRAQAIMSDNLEQAKKALLEDIIIASDGFMSPLRLAYPDHERMSWERQEREARALMDDPLAEAPLLESLSSARGIPLEEMAQKVIDKVDTYTEALQIVLGEQQRCETLVKSAATLDDLNTVIFRIICK